MCECVRWGGCVGGMCCQVTAIQLLQSTASGRSMWKCVKVISLDLATFPLTLGLVYFCFHTRLGCTSVALPAFCVVQRSVPPEQALGMIPR